MIAVFTWTGFICLMLIALALTFFSVVTLMDIVINRTRILNRTFKRMQSFYESMPKRECKHKYAITIYDYDIGKFVQTKYMSETGQTDEESEALREQWRKENAKSQGRNP